MTEIHDECFKVTKNRTGTYQSFDLENKPLVISLSEQACVNATRFYLKGKEGGFLEEDRSYAGTVDGKL
jgi:hypothetical protein